MSHFMQIVEREISDDIKNGMKPQEAVIKAGFKLLDGCTELYYLSHGLYNDKVIFARIKEGDA